jgi:hypothetical protein
MPELPDTDGHSSPPGAGATSDPLALLSRRRLRTMARQAQGRRRRGQDLTTLAEQAGVDARRLRLLADAWDEAGPSGIDALGPAVATPVTIGAHADAALERWRARHYPLELLHWEIWRNRVTVWRILPPRDRHAEASRIPLLQLRVTHEGRWHLYRKASKGEWWPVTVCGAGRQQRLEDCLEAARIDPGNRFWSTPGIPLDDGLAAPADRTEQEPTEPKDAP